MKLLLFFWSLICLYQEDVPLKPFDEFELKLNFSFKKRPQVDKYTMNFEESKQEFERRNTSGDLPFLTIDLKFLKLSDEEVRVRVVNSESKLIYTKKANLDNHVEFDLGFTDDLKDHVSAHEFNIYLLTGKRKETSRIHLFVTEDGTFLVNNEKRGKF
jgi:hypothetical protein